MFVSARTVVLVCAATCSLASAQSQLVPQRITSPVKDRGAYNLATGTWTQAIPGAAFNSDVLYSNNAPSGYFFGATPTWDGVDHGRIPSTTSPAPVGTGNIYEIDCYEFAYCTNDPATMQQITIFFDLYAPCSDVDSPAANPVAGFFATGLPAGTTSGTQNCWIIAFDLSNTTVTFDLNGDGNGTWDNDQNTDSFGWLGSYPTATPSNGTGPTIAGSCAPGTVQGSGTKFLGTQGTTNNTGLGTDDFFWIDDNGGVLTPNANGGCFFFGGCNTLTGSDANPWGGFWMELFGEEGDSCSCSGFCTSLVNATGGAAILTATGTDANVDLGFTSTPVPNTTGQFFYGPMMLSGAQPLGDGVRCVGGMTTRLLPFVNAGMMMQLPNTASISINYTAPYAAGLTGVKHFQHWFRSGLSTGTGSNTSDAVSVTF